MSLLSHLLSNSWDDVDHPYQHCLGLHPENFSIIPANFLETRPTRSHRGPHSHYYRPWGELMRRENEGGLSTVKSDKDKFQVVLDVQHFSPEEINVKVAGKYVLVEGNHDEKQDDHGWITRKFTRKYMIPEQCDLDKIESKLSSDGVLSICVPRKEVPKVEGERTISIQQTGKPAIREKESEEKPEEKK